MAEKIEKKEEKAERVITMSYTLEDYRRDIKERALKMMTPDDVIKAFPAEELHRWLPFRHSGEGINSVFSVCSGFRLLPE